MKRTWLRPNLRGAALLAAATIVLLAWGCATRERGVAEPAPQIPVFMSGPMGLLLTNADGFSAHLVMETPGRSNRVVTVTGELLGRSGKLLFSPTPAKRSKGRAGGFIFMWDVTAKSGWITSEALQGYAPVGASERYAFVTVNSVPGEPGAEEADVASGDGMVTAFRVWRAPEARGFPRRIATVSPPGGPTVQLTNIRLEAPRADLFDTPEGFTKFASADAMMLELISRGQAGHRGDNTDWGNSTPGAPRGPANPTGMRY